MSPPGLPGVPEAAAAAMGWGLLPGMEEILDGSAVTIWTYLQEVGRLPPDPA